METLQVEEQSPAVRRLIRDAAIAIEIFGEDNLERFIEELKQLMATQQQEE